MAPSAATLPALCGLGTAGLLAIWGYLLRAKENVAKGIPLVPAVEVHEGSLVAVCGKATSPVTMASPVRGAPCVFIAQRTRSGESPRRGGGGSSFAIGGFYLDDGTRRAFVAPAGARLTGLADEEAAQLPDPGALPDAGSDAISAWVIHEGDTVCVFGRAHSAQEMLAALRESSGGGLPPELLNRLMEEAGASGGAEPFPCFYADGGLFWAVRSSYEDFIRDSSSTAGLLLGVGLLAAGVCAVVLVGALLGII